MRKIALKNEIQHFFEDLPWLLKAVPTSSTSKKQGKVREKNKEKKNNKKAKLKG